ncbi:host-nuclease inhibitor Gam family protein [Candidatus Saccharibacteria bacterium]|nr:host-nuclease inhibitor Gam family protein [Candidatus Saccharibacteria bacterium]
MATPVSAKPAIQSDAQAGIEAQEHLAAKAAIAQIDDAEEAAITALKQQFAKLREPHVAIRDDRFERVQAWAEATRNGRKTIRFPNGREFRWRTASSAKLIISGTLETIIQSLLKRRDWKKFLKVELKKSSLAAHPTVVEETDGLRLERGEYVSIG